MSVQGIGNFTKEKFSQQTHAHVHLRMNVETEKNTYTLCSAIQLCDKENIIHKKRDRKSTRVKCVGGKILCVAPTLINKSHGSIYSTVFRIQ